MKLPFCLILLAAFSWHPAFAAEHKVSSAAEISQLAENLKPGDSLILSDGEWKDQVLKCSAKGTAEQPISYRAQTSGKVVLTGKSSVIIDGEHLVVSGLFLKNGELTGDGVKLSGRHCRLTETSIEGGNYKFFAHISGSENRLDHCYLAGKTNDHPTLQVEVESKPNQHRIDHNHFGPRPPLGRNGGETIRVGYSGQSMSSSGTVVEKNLFDRCDGELEIISSKSCDNIYRGNTFLECAGMFTLRHGNRCLVEGNFFIGKNKKGSGGIRVIGEDHIVINNYIEGVEKGGFWITSGITNSPLVGYFQSKNCLIAFNTFVDSPGPALELQAGLGSARRTLLPTNITVANNIFIVNQGSLIKGKDDAGYKWMGNFAWKSSDDTSDFPAIIGLKKIDPKLVRSKDGILRPTSESPVRGLAEGKFEKITTDIDGQKRKTKPDIGCDEMSVDPALNRPLRPEDVGPAWNRAEKK